MRYLLVPMLLAAATLPATASTPQPAAHAELTGLEFVPLRTAMAKRGERPSKPERPIEYKPVEVALHFHVDADGKVAMECRESHPQADEATEDER